MRQVTIRIWNGNTVRGVFTVNPHGGYSTPGAVGGAENSSKVDVELDPWKGLIVDHRVEHPMPLSIVPEPES